MQKPLACHHEGLYIVPGTHAIVELYPQLLSPMNYDLYHHVHDVQVATRARARWNGKA